MLLKRGPSVFWIRPHFVTTPSWNSFSPEQTPMGTSEQHTFRSCNSQNTEQLTVTEISAGNYQNNALSSAQCLSIRISTAGFQGHRQNSHFPKTSRWPDPQYYQISADTYQSCNSAPLMYPVTHVRPTDLVSHLSQQPTAQITAPPQNLTRPRLKFPRILQNAWFITVFTTASSQS